MHHLLHKRIQKKLQEKYSIFCFFLLYFLDKQKQFQLKSIPLFLSSLLLFLLLDFLHLSYLFLIMKIKNLKSRGSPVLLTPRAKAQKFFDFHNYLSYLFLIMKIKNLKSRGSPVLLTPRAKAQKFFDFHNY